MSSSSEPSGARKHTLSPGPAAAAALDGARLDGDASSPKVFDRRLDRAHPHEAEIAVPRAHGLARD
jgi:hypothetical protein